ncbi:hypothetical protein ACFX1X_031475 [Malus domestica]
MWSALSHIASVRFSVSSSSLGVNIDQAQALALPCACNTHKTDHVPDTVLLERSSTPADSPSSETPTSPSGSGFKTVPSTHMGSSDGNSNKMACFLLFFLLFIASYASTSTSNY